MMSNLLGGFGFPLFIGPMMLIWLLIFLIIAFLVYRDANTRGMNGLLWGILALIPMANILFLILYIVIRESSTQNPIHGDKTPVEILKERYARGEITGEEFRAIRDDLKNS